MSDERCSAAPYLPPPAIQSCPLPPVTRYTLLPPTSRPHRHGAAPYLRLTGAVPLGSDRQLQLQLRRLLLHPEQLLRRLLQPVAVRRVLHSQLLQLPLVAHRLPTGGATGLTRRRSDAARAHGAKNELPTTFLYLFLFYLKHEITEGLIRFIFVSFGISSTLRHGTICLVGWEIITISVLCLYRGCVTILRPCPHIHVLSP